MLRLSWPLDDQVKHFELGAILNAAATDLMEPARIGELGLHHAGIWECDLADNSLVWAGGAYEMFGLPRGSRVARDQVVGHYCPGSLEAMERLRSHAIRHRQGFTLDAENAAAVGGRRRIRIVAAPVCGECTASRSSSDPRLS